HLAKVVAILTFTAGESLRDHEIDYCSQFLSHDGLVLDEISRQNAFLVQDFHRFQRCIEAAIQAGERIVSCGFHGLLSVVSKYAVCLARQMELRVYNAS